MTKEDLIKEVRETKSEGILSNAVKEMVISYIETSYYVGFNEGMKVASDIQNKTFNMLIAKEIKTATERDWSKK